MEGLFRQVLEKYPDKVKLVVKHFPLRNHKYAKKAAQAALAANNQGKFWEFHQKLFENQKALNDEKISEIAKELNLDANRFEDDMNSPAISGLINRDMKNGREIGVRGTPTIFINGKKLTKRNLAGFSEMIEEALEKRR